MTGFDFAIILVLVIQAFLGFQRGFIRIIFDILAIAGGVYLGVRHYQELGEVVQYNLHISTNYANLVAFICIWTAIFLSVYLLSKLVNIVVTLTGLGLMNRLGGFVLGVAKGVFIILPIVIPMFFLKVRIVENSKLIQPLKPYLDSIVDMYFQPATHVQSDPKETMTNRV